MGTDSPGKLRRLLDHARQSTAYYAARLPPPPESLTQEQMLAQLPFLSRQDLRREKARLLSAVGDTGGWRLARTTGTTGEPAEVIWDARARAADEAAFARHVDRCLSSERWRERDVFHVTLHAGAASRALPSPWNPGARLVKWNLLRAWQRSDSGFVESLAHLHGCVVTALPSVAELLARRVLAVSGPGFVRPLLIILSGETLEPETVTLVSRTFSCPVTSLYTLAELGIVGGACRKGEGYHIEEQLAIVEVVDEKGKPPPSGEAGEVVVTALENFAMPLIRYRTRDHGYWLDGPCGCGVRAPCLVLTKTRRPMRLLTASGATVNVVRFWKVLATLDVEQLSLDQRQDDTVVLSYRAPQALDGSSLALAEACLRSALGPDDKIRIDRVWTSDAREGKEAARLPAGSRQDAAPAEPAGPDPSDVARWLQTVLEKEKDVDAAVLTGSALDPEATTRFSDLDLVLLIRGDPGHVHWLELSHRIRRHVPMLSVSLDTLIDLPRRAPLIACRLLREQIPVRGRVDESSLAWPSVQDLRAQARFWAQDATARLWQRLSTLDRAIPDPLREAWLAGKFGLDALRYHYLILGERETAARAVLRRAQLDPAFAGPGLTDLLHSLEVAREHRPPPLSVPDAVVRSLSAALSCVRSLSAEL
jgi:phenylacetate-coenzyme A ligase PaaK-like adenylate-forming protein